jgi:hypothetical protein
MFTLVFSMVLLKKIKYQPNNELNFLKKKEGKIKSGSASKQQMIIPRYKSILNIKDLRKITLNYIFNFLSFSDSFYSFFIYNNLFDQRTHVIIRA